MAHLYWVMILIIYFSFSMEQDEDDPMFSATHGSQFTQKLLLFVRTLGVDVS